MKLKIQPFLLLAFSLFFWLGMQSQIFAGGLPRVSPEEMLNAIHLEPDEEEGEEIFEVCAACHGSEGWGDPQGAFPALAGQHASVTIQQVVNFRTQARKNTTMYPFALQVESAQELADVAAYIQGLALNPKPTSGPGTDLAKGKMMYTQKCLACHGAKGEGNGPAKFSAIGKQNYHYLLRQLIEIRDRKRKNVNPGMVVFLKNVSDKDLAILADYVSRLEGK